MRPALPQISRLDFSRRGRAGARRKHEMSRRAEAKLQERPERSTRSAVDWEQAAVELIAEKGVQAVAIEPLARRMGITKGSFYWHFASRESLLEPALQRWEEHDSRNLASALGEIADPRDRLISF